MLYNLVRISKMNVFPLSKLCENYDFVILRERSDRENPVFMRSRFLTSFGMTSKSDFSHNHECRNLVKQDEIPGQARNDTKILFSSMIETYY